MVPTLILAQIGLGRTTQDAETDSSVPRLYVGTDQIDNNDSKINFKPSTIRSTSSGGANMTLEDSESSSDVSLGENVVPNGKCSSPPLKDAFVVQGQSHNPYDLEERGEIADQV